MSVIFNGNNNINCCPPPSADLHNSTTSNSAASSNDLHLFFNSLELDAGNGAVKVFFGNIICLINFPSRIFFFDFFYTFKIIFIFLVFKFWCHW